LLASATISFETGDKMKRMGRFLKKMARKLRGLLPMQLPRAGEDSFNKFCDWVLDTYDLPARRDYREAVATLVMHTKELDTKKAPYEFARAIRNRMAKQTAYEQIEKIRAEVKSEENEAKKQAEAAAMKATSSVEPPQGQDVQKASG
jgi:hypothetical protein